VASAQSDIGVLSAETGEAKADRASNPIAIRLDIAPISNGYFFTWSIPEPSVSTPGKRKFFQKYTVAKPRLEEGTKIVRSAFETFATAFVDKRTSEELDLLEKLAEAGRQLYEIIMPPDGTKGPSSAAAFRIWFETEVLRLAEPSADPNYVIEVVLQAAAPDFIPPFGLVFTPRLGRQKALSTAFENFTDFWSISLRCACFTREQLQQALLKPVPGDMFDAVIVREQRDKSYHLVERRVKDGHRFASFEDKTKMAGRLLKNPLAGAFLDKSVLFHFDLEATAPSEYPNFPYDEDGERMLSAQDFQSILREAENMNKDREKPEWPVYALAVIDREAIIRGDRSPAWLEIFFGKPWIGLIAVEGDVRSKQVWDEVAEVRPDRFLGLLFLRSILERQGKRLIDSIVDARRDCWPFSLFFGVYCNTQQPWITKRPALVEDINNIIPLLGKHHPAAKLTQPRSQASSGE
jgi:hypothetical protein